MWGQYNTKFQKYFFPYSLFALLGTPNKCSYRHFHFVPYPEPCPVHCHLTTFQWYLWREKVDSHCIVWALNWFHGRDWLSSLSSNPGSDLVFNCLYNKIVHDPWQKRSTIPMYTYSFLRSVFPKRNCLSGFYVLTASLKTVPR